MRTNILFFGVLFFVVPRLCAAEIVAYDITGTPLDHVVPNDYGIYLSGDFVRSNVVFVNEKGDLVVKSGQIEGRQLHEDVKNRLAYLVQARADGEINRNELENIYSKEDGSLDRYGPDGYRGLDFPEGGSIEVLNGARAGNYALFPVMREFKGRKSFDFLSFYCGSDGCYMSDYLVQRGDSYIGLERIFVGLVGLNGFREVGLGQEPTTTEAIKIPIFMRAKGGSGTLSINVRSFPDSRPDVLSTTLPVDKNTLWWTALVSMFGAEGNGATVRNANHRALRVFEISEHEMSDAVIRADQLSEEAAYWSKLEVLGSIDLEGGVIVLLNAIESEGSAKVFAIPLIYSQGRYFVDYGLTGNQVFQVLQNVYVVNALVDQLGIRDTVVSKGPATKLVPPSEKAIAVEPIRGSASNDRHGAPTKTLAMQVKDWVSLPALILLLLFIVALGLFARYAWNRTRQK